MVKRTIALLTLCFLLFLASCGQSGDPKAEARLGDFAPSGAKVAELTVRRESGCAMSTGMSDDEEGEARLIAFPEESDLAAVDRMTELETLYLDFESGEPDQELMRKITERFLTLPSLKFVFVSHAPFDLGALQSALPPETHLVGCRIESAVDLTNVGELYLTDTGWDEGSFKATEGVSSLALELASVPESMDKLSIFPGIARLTVPAAVGDYTGEWPVQLTAEAPAIPAGISAPFPEEEIRAYLDAHPETAVILRPALEPAA